MSAYVEHPEDLRSQGLDALRTTGRPVALTEIGPEFWKSTPSVDGTDLTVVTELGVAYALFWSSWGNTRMGLADMPNADALFDDPDLLTLEDWAAP